MIQVTKDEARILRELYPEYKVARTAIQRSRRHRYYATEKYELMKAIAATNEEAAKIVKEADRIRNLNHRRMEKQGEFQYGECE